jgi:hypothetical protein
MRITPKAKPVTTTVIAWPLVTSGSNTTATTDNTTPAAKCWSRLRTFAVVTTNAAIAAPIVAVRTGRNVERANLTTL